MSTTISRIYSFVDDKNNGVPITATRVDAELNQQIVALNQKALIKATAPLSPIAGMVWYDSTNKTLKQYRNSEWVSLGVVQVATSAMATPQEGDIWYDTTNNIIKSYNGSTWDEYTPLYIGDFKYSAQTATHGRWLLCDGAEVSRTTYADLFAVIGTSFGIGDGANTFNLPNGKGRVAVAKDAAQTEFDAIGETGGAKTHTLTTDEMPAHTHNHSPYVYDSSGGGSSDSWRGDGDNVNNPITSSSTGGGQAHNNLQPYVVLGNLFIRY